MNMLIILLVVFVVLTGFFIKTLWKEHLVFGNGDERGILGKIWLLIYAPIISFTIYLLFSIILMIVIGVFPAKKDVPKEFKSIVSFNDVFSSEGNFFLGCGSIESESYYFYYEKLENGGYKMDKIRTENVTIFEDSTKTPGIQFFKQDFVDKSWHKWAFSYQSDNIKIYIYVPPRSIQRNFTLDLK